MGHQGLLIALQVGPRGVHLEKDNVFNSQAYAAGAPSVTISNDPSAAAGAGGGQAAYSGASQPSSSSGAYQNDQSTQSGYGSANQAAAYSGSSTGGVRCLPK